MFEPYQSKHKRQFIEPDKISRHLRCSICHDVFQDPVRTACGHTFCYICIENWTRINKTCPLCKQSIAKRRLQKDLIAFNIIDDLPTKCIHQNCECQGAYSVIKKHQRQCKFKPKKIAYQEKSSGIEVVEIMNDQSDVVEITDQDMQKDEVYFSFFSHKQQNNR